MDKEKQRDEVISGLRSCLVSTKGKCDLRQINYDFRMLMGYEIPYVQLGFKNLEQFICSIPSLTTTRVNGQLLVDAKITEKSSHIASLVNKQKESKKKPRPPPRYTSNRDFNHTSAGPRWRPRNVNHNWRKSYQSSPRPAAVSHNQFVNIPSTSRASNPPPRLASRLTIREVAQPQVSQPEPSRKQERKPEAEDTSNSLVSKAKKRIAERMADINITVTNKQNPAINGRDTNTLFRQDSSISLSPDGIQRLQEESLAAISPQTSTWQTTWSNSLEQLNGAVKRHPQQPTSNPQQPISNSQQPMSNNTPVIDFKFSGDSLEDLFTFTNTHNLPQPSIKLIPRRSTLPKGTFYDCHIKVGSKSFSSYPGDYHDKAISKQKAAKKAMDELLPQYKRQSLLISDDKDVLERIPPIVQRHTNGVWNRQLESDYIEQFAEQLPVNWLEIVDVLSCISISCYVDRFVLRYCKPGEDFQKGNDIAPHLNYDVSVPSNTVKFDSNTTLIAEISCAESAGEIWCRQIDTLESNKFSEMMTKLEEYYNDHSENKKAHSVEVGGYYVALSDFIWYRVRVFEVNGADVHCFSIDFGDEWIVQKSEIYKLDPQFAREQAQAFVCRLAGVEELYEASKSSEYLHSLLGKIVQVQLDPSNDDSAKSSPTDPALSVILYDQDSDSVINQQLIYYIGMESALPVLDEKSPTEVYVTYAENDGSVYIQVRSLGYDHLTLLLQELEVNILENKFEFLKEPVTKESSSNKLYFTRYALDGNWYRTIIADWSPDEKYAQILFVDYGITPIVTVKDQSFYPLDELSDVISQFPHQAIKVRIALNSIPSNFASRITSLIPKDTPVLAKLITTDTTNGSSVEFFKRSETDNVLFSVNTAISVETEFKNASGDGNNNTGKLKSTKLERLISLNQFDGASKNVPSSGSLRCPPLPGVGCYFDVIIPCAVSPYNFFIQPYVSAEKLRKLMTDLQAKCKENMNSPLKIQDILPGKIYASKHEDGLWYRTSVMKVINVSSISVFYCDFGYYANLTVNQLIPIDPEFMELPHQAIKAKLANVMPKYSKWTMDDCLFFQNLVCGKSFVSILVAEERDALYRYDTLLCLNLIDTATNVDVHIKKILINEGIAKKIEEN